MSDNSLVFKRLLKQAGISSIPFRVVEIPDEGPGEELVALFRTFAPPLIVRPVAAGHEGVMIARTYDEFVEMLEEGFKNADEIILEEFIPGAPVSVGVIEGYRDQDLYTLPPISKVPLSREDIYELESIARQAHAALGLRHYSRIDFVVSAPRGMFVSRVVPLPSLHEESVFHQALSSVGAPLSHFLDHVIERAMQK